MDKNKKSRFGKIMKVGTVPAVAVSLLTTGVIIPATVFSANIIGTSTLRSREATIRQYKAIYGNTHWQKYMKMIEDKTIGPFKVNGKPTKVWKITRPGMERKPVTKAMIFVHGLRNSHWNAITFARQMLNRGYVVYCYDQRESGENIHNGKISFGQHEADDLSNLYRNVVSLNKELKSVIVYGQSNGAGTTISFAEKHQTQVREAKTKFGVNTNFMLESGYTSGHAAMDGLVKARAKGPAGSVLAWLTTPQMKNTMNEYMGVNEDYDYASNEHIGLIKQRLYIAHGSADNVIPVEQGQTLGKAAKDNGVDSMYHEWDGLGHIGISLAKKSQDEMFEEAIPFLEGTVVNA